MIALDKMAFVGAFALMVGGVALALYCEIANANGVVRERLQPYIRSLDRDLTSLFSKTKGAAIVKWQLAAGGGIVSVTVLSGRLELLILLPVVAFVPSQVVKTATRQRITRLENQLDGWLASIANALRVTSSVTDAFDVSLPLIRPPLRQELEIVAKELRLGTPLRDAFGHLEARVPSKRLSSALTAMLLGQNMGGELPHLLEVEAATIRDGIRLREMVHSKLSSGRIQLYFIAAMPFGVLVGLLFYDSSFFDSLIEDPDGPRQVMMLGLGWVWALRRGQEILSVDV